MLSRTVYDGDVECLGRRGGHRGPAHHSLSRGHVASVVLMIPHGVAEADLGRGGDA